MIEADIRADRAESRAAWRMLRSDEVAAIKWAEAAAVDAAKGGTT